MTGDAWRWDVARHGYVAARPSIFVIEPVGGVEREGRRVPFGFGPRDPEPEREPDVWEGNPS